MRQQMQFFKNKPKFTSKGQSFIELALVLTALMFIVAGVVELGNLINQYLETIDAAREGARAANLQSFYKTTKDPTTHVITKVIGDAVYDFTAREVWNTLNPGCMPIDENTPVLPDKGAGTTLPDPITGCLPQSSLPVGQESLMGIPFDPATDDIVISVLSVNGGALTRFPDAQGWSRFGNHISAVSDGALSSLIDSSAPNTGFVLVEIFYNYHQMLGFPFLSTFLPNPIPVHAYSIMPYPGAEPTPTALP
jgi:hypothetical protein